MSKEDVEEFKEKCEPLIEYLNKNWHPHIKIIITPTSAELVSGEMSTGQILDYVRD